MFREIYELDYNKSMKEATIEEMQHEGCNWCFSCQTIQPIVNFGTWKSDPRKYLQTCYKCAAKKTDDKVKAKAEKAAGKFNAENRQQGVPEDKRRCRYCDLVWPIETFRLYKIKSNPDNKRIVTCMYCEEVEVHEREIYLELIRATQERLKAHKAKVKLLQPKDKPKPKVEDWDF